jgi:Fe-S-cluster containining protein
MSIIEDCRLCDAHCCKHVAVHIPTPASKKDYDNIRWYLLHENIWISIDLQNEWLLEFRSPCTRITKDYKCNDYENRPMICQIYPDENELCERQSEEKSYKFLFTNIEEFESYLITKKIDWKLKSTKTIKK